MPVNWSGSRPNLNRHQTSPSIRDFTDLVSPFVQYPSLASLSGSPRSEASATIKRRIVVNQKHKPPLADARGYLLQAFPSNQITTSKYTAFTFIPKNLYEQFRGIANFYFLSLVVLQAFDYFKEVSVAVTAAPLIFIVLVTGVKDALEDFRRHISDDYVNRSFTYLLSPWTNLNCKDSKSSAKRFQKSRFSAFVDAFVTKIMPWKKATKYQNVNNPDTIAAEQYLEKLSDGHLNEPRKGLISPKEIKWTKCEWRNVKVGDFVFLRNNDSVPADIVIVSTSEAENLCFVETKNLDGETNLKVKRGIQELAHIKTPAQCAKAKFVIDSEVPDPNLYTYNAVAILKPHDSSEIFVPISADGILLRGCYVRNTAWVIGVVVYTGKDSKIMLNAGATPTKRSRIDKQINPQVMLNFVILIGMCLICGLAAAIFEVSFKIEDSSYIGGGTTDPPEITALLNTFRCMIIFQNIIPIALYISIDIAKTVQSYFIHTDLEMYDEESDTPAICQSWKLCDDLGQIEYIFSDKTGTLTSNSMELRRISVNGILYGALYPKLSDQKSKNQDEMTMRRALAKLCDPCYLSENVSFIDTTIHQHITDGGLHGVRIREFFTLLAVCHTVFAEAPDPAEPHKLLYKSQSPDEAALVSAAKDVGFAFIKRSDNFVTVNILGEIRDYEILKVIEFSSDRKRMSIIMRRPEGEIVLMCKGADSVIMGRLHSKHDQYVKESTEVHLSDFANNGFRTLCLGFRVIPQDEYQRWSDDFNMAQSSIANREEEVDRVAQTIEKDLTLMGCTAIEDKLQDGVPESIAKLSDAGIKIWVLTGDKMETAINIGFSCNLLKKNMSLIVIQSDTSHKTEGQLVQALDRFWNPDGTPKHDGSYALIMDGDTLKYALEPSTKALTLELGCRCKAVICCRVSPLQKAKVVQLVRKGLGAVCLAIGDGSNDVSMIQEADIGIGISGKEGLQAVMASDYAIAQFRFLSRLLLVHGRWAYMRTAELTLNYFYKNVVWLFVLFWYQFFCAFSASVITDFTYSLYYNTFFTFGPTMYLGIFDQDVGDHLSLLVPQLYYKGIQQTLYNTQRFWLYIADGVYQSVVSFFVMYTIFFDSSMDAKGQEVSKDAMGTFLAYSIILTVNIYALMCASDLSWVGFASFAVVIGIWIIYCVSYSFVPEAYTFGVTVAFYKNPNFYAGIILSVTLCLLPRLTAKFLQQYFWPSDTDIMREIQKYRSKDIRQVLNEITGHPITNEMLPSDEVLAGDVESLKDDRSVMSAKSGFVPRESPEVTSGPRSKSEEQLPPSQESGKKKRRVQSAFSLKEKPPKVSDGFGANADKDNSGAGSSDLEQAHHKSEDIDKPSSSRIVESEGRFRKSSVSVIIKENIQKATRFVQKLGRQVSSRPPVRSEARSSSIIYMGDNVAVNNTGFAFSQDKGMTRVITQSPLATPLYEDPYEEEVDLSLIPPPRIASGKGSSRELSRREDSTSQIGSSKRIDGPATLGRFLEPRRPSGLRQSQLYASIDDAIEEGTDMLRGRSDPGSDGIRFEIQASTPEMTEVFPDAVGSSSQSLAVEGPEEPGSAEASPAPFVSGRATPTQENAPTDVTQEPIPTPPSDIPDVVPNVSEQISTLGVPSVERDGKTQISDPTDANSVPVSDTNAQPETDLS